jgi:hypothetical protein
MSSAWVEAPEAESIDEYAGDEGAEDYPGEMYGEWEGESDDAESRYSRRLQRARRIASARQRRRAALTRARSAAAIGPPSAAAVVRRTEADIAKLEVQSSVQADAVSSMLASHRRQLRAGTTAAAAGAIIPSLLSFLQTSAPDLGSNRYLRAGLPLAPLFFLRPTDRGLSDRRLWAVAAVAGLAVADDFKSRGQVVERLDIDRSLDALPAGAVVPFRAVALDRSSNRATLPAGATLEWKTSNSKAVDVDEATGQVTAAGTVGDVATIQAILRGPDGRELDSDFVTVTVV